MCFYGSKADQRVVHNPLRRFHDGQKTLNIHNVQKTFFVIHNAKSTKNIYLNNIHNALKLPLNNIHS